jgi:phytanoyl-CoA hydroxylase
MGLTQEQKDFFSQNGYLAWGPILEPAEVGALREEYDDVFRRAEGQEGYRNLSVKEDAPEEEKKKARTRMLQVMQMCERSLAFRRLLYDSRFLDIVQELMGPSIMLFHDQALFKPARTGGAVYWHQDNAYWGCAPANLVSCWIALDDAVKENGAMQVIPGSHRRAFLHKQGKDTGSLLETAGLDPSTAVTAPLSAGGCMFHHCQTLHYTQPNTTDRERRAFIMHYMAPGTRDNKGEVMRVSWSRPLLRMCL